VIKQTTALRKISAMLGRIWVICGGQGAGKTISVLTLLVNHASSKPDREIGIYSEELSKMKSTVIKDFIKVMKLSNLWSEFSWNKTENIYTFPNGSWIKFQGLDKSDVGKGSRIHVAYFNEINKISFEAYQQIASRCGRIICDYNPDAEFFVDTEILTRSDAGFLRLTFEDNEELNEIEHNEILGYKALGFDADGNEINAYWANKWRVYGLGMVGGLLGAVYSNWQLCDNIPEDAKYLGTGLDFGYSSDPAAIIDLYEMNGDLYLDEVLYATEQGNDDLAMHLQGKLVFADSAEPKSIQATRDKGIQIKPAIKGVGSVNFGINELQKKKMHVTKKSLNLQTELRNYVWLTDRNGKALNVPKDKFNHLMDAMRYGYTGAKNKKIFKMISA
jgi:phage terminase large subunit